MKLTLILILGVTLFIGCGSRGHHVQIIEKQPQPAIKHTVEKKTLPPAPKKNIKLKEVDDTNYSDKYMYPEDTAAAKKDPIKSTESSTTSNTMTKEECISMISQEKFDKYTTMFGSEAASIKRCAMLKAMNK
jgi:hypothetical protein